MSKLPQFKCSGEDQISFPEFLIKKENLTPQEIFTTGKGMAEMAITLKDYEHKETIPLPFSNTIESEALGGTFKLCTHMTGPIATSKGVYLSMEAIKKSPHMNLETGTIKEVLEAIETIKKIDQTPIVLNIEGPFTICEFIMDTRLFYKGLLKKEPIIVDFLKKLKNDLLSYIDLAFEKGVSIISYGDPSGNLNIVGKKFFSQMNQLFNKSFFQELSQRKTKGLIHLCGQATNDMQATEIIKLEPYLIPKVNCYANALNYVTTKEEHIIIMGNYCLNLAHKPYNKSFIHKVNII